MDHQDTLYICYHLYTKIFQLFMESQNLFCLQMVCVSSKDLMVISDPGNEPDGL